MREARSIMGMPITIEIVGAASLEPFDKLFLYFFEVDERFSTYKPTSEIMRINRGEVHESEYSPQMREVFALAEKTNQETAGFFDIKKPDGSLDPSGIVKGWAIYNASLQLKQMGFENFYIDAGGDIQTAGHNSETREWSVGIRHPKTQEKIVKVIYPKNKGVATSGSYIRGNHIYNPHNPADTLSAIVSITLIGPNVLEADRFATAAFAMGAKGIEFIESLDSFDGYAIDKKGIATMTSGFRAFTKQ